MKCITNDGEIKRVSDTEAYKMVKSGWKFCAKKLWKEKIRDSNKQPKEIKKEEVVEQQLEEQPKTNKYKNKKKKSI